LALTLPTSGGRSVGLKPWSYYYYYYVEELPDVWKESVIVPIYKKRDKTDCSDYLIVGEINTGTLPY
jgi:hypothetical protein